MLIDTHAHLSKEYFDDFSTVVDNAIKNGVEKIIISGCDEEGIKEGLEIIKKFENVYMTVGFHPDEVEKINQEKLNWLESIILSNNKIIGIGEIGLDYHYTEDNKELQKKLFISQLELAEKLNYPIVVHSRDAVLDTINILKQFKLNGIIHCFSGSYEVAMEYIKLGYHLGIGGVLTFSNSKLSETIKKIPCDRIVLETDSPYLAPTPFRGEKNEPKNVRIVAEKLSQIYDVSINEIENITSSSVLTIFDLK